jgi:hypothetical protein
MYPVSLGYVRRDIPVSQEYIKRISLFEIGHSENLTCHDWKI